MPVQITEAREALDATPSSGGRIRVTLITPGWGSSGYYSAAVLEKAAADGIFGAGLQCFVDHPTQTDLYERPERSVKDLGAVLAESAQWDPAAQELWAPAQLLPPHAEVFSQPEMAKAIGMSIRASADVSMGEAEGRRGRIVGELVEAQSVDFVTRAGRGGRYQVIESATPSRVVRRAVHRGVAESTANEQREQLQQALIGAYGGENAWVWIRDFDDTNVWFELDTPDSEGTYQQAYTASDSGVELTGDSVEVRAQTNYVPVDPAGGSTTTTQESQEDTMPQIEEARMRQLEEAASRVPTLESERDAAVQRADTAESRLASVEARDGARPVVAAKVAESTVLAGRTKTQSRVVESVLRDLPMTDGKVDDTKLTAAVEAAVKDAEAEFADAAPVKESFGAFGSQQGARSTEVAEADALAKYDAASARTFGRTITGA